jgi:hypothetical protein
MMEKDRSTDSCEVCRFWDCLSSSNPSDDENSGYCRRLPPRVSTRLAIWPLVCGDDWCGEFTLSPHDLRIMIERENNGSNING